jgi:hypothetical protein
MSSVVQSRPCPECGHETRAPIGRPRLAWVCPNPDCETVGSDTAPDWWGRVTVMASRMDQPLAGRRFYAFVEGFTPVGYGDSPQQAVDALRAAEKPAPRFTPRRFDGKPGPDEERGAWGVWDGERKGFVAADGSRVTFSCRDATGGFADALNQFPGRAGEWDVVAADPPKPATRPILAEGDREEARRTIVGVCRAAGGQWPGYSAILAALCAVRVPADDKQPADANKSTASALRAALHAARGQGRAWAWAVPVRAEDEMIGALASAIHGIDMRPDSAEDVGALKAEIERLQARVRDAEAAAERYRKEALDARTAYNLARGVVSRVATAVNDFRTLKEQE